MTAEGPSFQTHYPYILPYSVEKLTVNFPLTIKKKACKKIPHHIQLHKHQHLMFNRCCTIQRKIRISHNKVCYPTFFCNQKCTVEI